MATDATNSNSGEPGHEEHLRLLMTRYLGGEIEAFEALYAAVGPQLGRYLGALTGDRGRAEDLLQETFLRVHRSRRSYDPALPVRPWVFAIARHVYLMDARSRRRHQARELPLEAAPEVRAPPGTEGLDGRQTLGHALRGLRHERREPLLLRYVLGMTFREIGHRLGIHEGAARVRAARGMAELRRLLGRPQKRP